MKLGHGFTRKSGAAIKRLLSTFLAVLLLMTCLPLSALANPPEAESGNPFADVNPSDWFYDAVQYVYDRGIFNGTSPTTFSPDVGMTRAMFVTALGRFAGADADAYSGTGGFSDVNPNEYYAPYVAWAAEQGIAAGVGDGRFDVGGLITREQLVKFAANYLSAYDITLPEQEAGKAPAHDFQSVSDWAKDALLQLWNTGVVNGDENGAFHPLDTARRCEAATFFMNLDLSIKGTEGGNAEKPAAGSSGSGSETDPSTPPGGTVTYTVTFDTSGGPAVDPIKVQRGGTISGLPQPSRTGYIFAGWYTDPAFAQRFDEEAAITANLTLYAQYIEITFNIDPQSYDVTEQAADIVEDDPVKADFAVQVHADNLTADDVKAGLRLTATSGVDDRDFSVAGSAPAFTVTMPDGWLGGVSYKLEIINSDIGYEKDSTKTAALYYFTVDREESNALSLKDVIYLPSNELSAIFVDEVSVDSISSGIYNFDLTGTQNAQPLEGYFTYNGDDPVSAGNILCIYDGSSPEYAIMGDTIYDSIAYIKVTDVSGGQISFTNASPEDVLYVPKTALVRQAEVSGYAPSAGGFSFVSTTNTFDSFKLGDTAAVARPLEIGDTLALYDAVDIISLSEQDALIMGRVTQITGTAPAYTVVCESVTSEDLAQMVDYHQTAPLDAGELIDLGYINEEDIIEQIEQQALGSGMVESLAGQYALLALETDLLEGELTSMDGLVVLMEDGSRVNAQQLRDIMDGNVQTNAVTVEKPKVTTKIATTGGKYGNGSLVATLTITFEIKMTNAQKDSLVIKFEIKFTQEVCLGVGADAGISWYKKWGVPLFPNDVWVSAYLDTKTYSAVDLKATVDTKLATPEKKKDPNTGKEIEVTEKKLDIASKINEIIKASDEKEAYDGVSGIYKTYQDFMANDWSYVELVRANLIKVPIALAGGLVQINVNVDFVLSGALNVSLSGTLSYQDGTRYSLNAKLAGRSITFTQTQIVDKKFSFDVFFVGRFGLKAGIELSLKVGLVSTKLNSVSVKVQVGIYLEWMGFFSYKYEKNYTQGTSSSSVQGAMYSEIGVYLDADGEVQAGDGKWKVSLSLLKLRFPLLSTESKNFVYGFSLQFGEGEKLVINKAKNALPENTFKMIQLDLKGGKSYYSPYPQDKFSIRFSNSAFSLTADNKIVVNTAKDYLEAEMIIIWTGSHLAFTSKPIVLRIPIVFTDSDSLTEKGLLTVKDQDGGVIWEKRVDYGKSIADSLPAKAEILNLLGYDNFSATLADGSAVNLKYSDEGHYTTTPSGVVVGNADFVYQITERVYTIDVNDIERPDGTKYSERFTSRYGESFDLSALRATRTDIAGALYTKFSKVQTRKGGVAAGLPVQDRLTADLAVQILDGAHTYHALYDDDSATVTYEFITTIGIGITSATEVLRRGGNITFDYTQHIAAVNDGFYVIASKDFDTGAAVTSDRTMKLLCKTASDYVLQFNLNGGSFVSGYTPPLYYNPDTGTPLPTQADLALPGKIFIGWFADAQFSGEPEETARGDNGHMTFYAMWRDPEYTIRFDANGGSGTMPEMEASYGTASPLTANAFSEPFDEYVVGRGFNSWNTEPDGSGTTYADSAAITAPKIDKNGLVTLYAQWNVYHVRYKPSSGPTLDLSMANALELCAQMPGGKITLLWHPSGNVHLRKTITLPDDTVFDGGGILRVFTAGTEGFTIFSVASGVSAEIKNIHVYGSTAPVVENSGTLKIEDLTVSAASGRVITNHAGGKMSMRYTSAMNGTGTDHIISNSGTMVIDNCSFIGNTSTLYGVLYNSGGCTAVVNNTTFLNNNSVSYATAIYNDTGTLYLLNSSIAGNDNGYLTGGIFTTPGEAEATYVINSIVASNTNQHSATNNFEGWSLSLSVNPRVKIYSSITHAQSKLFTEVSDSVLDVVDLFTISTHPKVATSPADAQRGAYLITPSFNQKPATLKSLAARVYLNYSNLDNIRVGYGPNRSTIVSLMGTAIADDLVTEYLGGGARDADDNRIGASYIALP